MAQIPEKRIKIQTVVDLLNNHYARFKRQNVEGSGFVGSVEEELGLTPAECKLVFSHPKVRNIKLKRLHSRLILEDDGEESSMMIEDDTTPESNGADQNIEAAFSENVAVEGMENLPVSAEEETPVEKLFN